MRGRLATVGVIVGVLVSIWILRPGGPTPELTATRALTQGPRG
jgi:hypothetical protein